jgi:hypothetical protein
VDVEGKVRAGRRDGGPGSEEEPPVEIAGVIAVLLFLAFVTLAVVTTVRTVRSVKRTVARGSAQARRVVEDNRLRARRYTHYGPAGEIAQLRLDLRASIDSTFAALGEGRAHDASLSEADALFARLNDHARALDTELKLLEREPDKNRLAAHLPSFTERTHRITHAADTLRWAAQDRARRFADDELAVLGRDIELEAGALRHWAPATPHAPGPAMDPAVDPDMGPATDPAMDPAVGPAANPAVGPAAGPAAGPAIGTRTDPAAGPGLGPVADPAVDPATGPSITKRGPSGL